MEIVEGRSELWEGIGEDKKECIRGAYSTGSEEHDTDEQRFWCTSRRSALGGRTSASHSGTSRSVMDSSLAREIFLGACLVPSSCSRA